MNNCNVLRWLGNLFTRRNLFLVDSTLTFHNTKRFSSVNRRPAAFSCNIEVLSYALNASVPRLFTDDIFWYTLYCTPCVIISLSPPWSERIFLLDIRLSGPLSSIPIALHLAINCVSLSSALRSATSSLAFPSMTQSGFS